MKLSIRKIIGTTVVILLTLFLVISDGEHFTLWFAILWGMVGVIAFLHSEARNWEMRCILPPVVQFALASLLIVATALATHWSALGRRDLIQCGYTMLALPFYKDGFTWAWSSLKSALNRQRA